MATVIGVRFRKAGKVYFFDPCDLQPEIGDAVIVETSRGVEYGETVARAREVPDERLVPPLRKAVRMATEEDTQRAAANQEKEREAFGICQEKIAKHGLEMKLVSVECAFDNAKITFYFTAENRVDFRELVKDLASVFRMRIELRQIGVRDEAKMVGGLGICGRPLCCSSHLCDFQPVSIKMAKEQGLSLNPTKISGTCGRLMCCLKYEQESYEHLLKITPKVGAVVDTKEGRGTVVDTNLISGQIKVCLDKSPDAIPSTFSRRQVKTIRDGGRVSVSKAEREALKNIEEN
ncbi:MAG: stage 0 sporulation family protein [Clostridia bacterium]|nr:stage 0 sporulation family protein [Clostridia bacterium]